MTKRGGYGTFGSIVGTTEKTAAALHVIAGLTFAVLAVFLAIHTVQMWSS